MTNAEINQRIEALAGGDSNDEEIDGLLAIIRELQEERAPRVTVSVVDLHTTEEKKESMQEWAGLVYQIGTIIEDRRDYTGEEMDPLWDYLWEYMDGIYEQVGPIIDRVEETVFGGPVGAEG